MLIKIKDQIIKDKKIIIASIIAGFVFTASVALITFMYSERIQGGIADSVLRFHVRASSDSFEDQLLKMEVKNAVLDSLYGGLPHAETREAAIAYVAKNIVKITEAAEEAISSRGLNYPVIAYMTTDFFPTMTYGDITLPPGFYDTLRIDIGEGLGENWWCVMFPPLCYVDLSVAELPQNERDALRHVLTSSEYEVISGSIDDITVRFRVVEWWQNRRSGDSGSTVAVRD
ncbi:MAG: stage II sporulation protein R [Defluviitaleaceae bacterium]|nr:stage II sporulation protein R [Defluviitaleaceae bacterium]